VKRAIPNALTLLNLLSGSMGIYLLYNDRPDLTLLTILICLAADVLDGALARMLGVSSNLGIQLDSLADVVSFGVLPSCILTWFLVDCVNEPTVYLMPAAFLFVCGAALRLARFNIDTRDRKSFYGLPVPSAALVIFGIMLVIQTGHRYAEVFKCNTEIFILLVVILPPLMLSNIRLWSFKGLGDRNGKAVLGGFLIIFAALVIWLGVAAIPLMVGVYILAGLINVYAKFY
jgi:CDP-diacylglycerol--serine O-phosphatidyltransferase